MSNEILLGDLSFAKESYGGIKGLSIVLETETGEGCVISFKQNLNRSEALLLLTFLKENYE